MTDEPLSPRRRLHHAIRNVFAQAIGRYYRQHPERIDDPDREGINAFLKVLEDTLREVDRFAIGDIVTLSSGETRPDEPRHTADR